MNIYIYIHIEDAGSGRLDLLFLRGSEALGGSICRVLRGSEALGGSICCVSRGSEALGGSFVVFYVSGRLSGGRMSNGAVAPGGSAKERPSRAWGEGERERGEARLVVFYEGLRFWGGLRF